MNKPKIIRVKTESSGKRLDIFLSQKLKTTRSKAQKMIGAKLILVNNKLPKKTGENLPAGAIITISDIEEKQSSPDSPRLKTQADFKIVSETPDYLVVDKPAGMLTHSTEKNEPDSLAELLLQKYPTIKKVGENPLRPGIVHRLDKDASGLLVVALNHKMFDCLKEQFSWRQVNKEYIVLAHGDGFADEGEINFSLARSKRAGRMAARPRQIRGKDNTEDLTARTFFEVEKKFINFTLLRVKIHTGRMHQIRAHLLAYNHPVVGDPLYFSKKQKRIWDKRAGRLFLHCAKLAFKDLNGKLQSFNSPLPEYLQKFLGQLKQI